MQLGRLGGALALPMLTNLAARLGATTLSRVGMDSDAHPCVSYRTHDEVYLRNTSRCQTDRESFKLAANRSNHSSQQLHTNFNPISTYKKVPRNAGGGVLCWCSLVQLVFLFYPPAQTTLVLSLMPQTMLMWSAVRNQS